MKKIELVDVVGLVVAGGVSYWLYQQNKQSSASSMSPLLRTTLPPPAPIIPSQQREKLTFGPLGWLPGWSIR